MRQRDRNAPHFPAKKIEVAPQKPPKAEPGQRKMLPERSPCGQGRPSRQPHQEQQPESLHGDSELAL